MSEIFTNILTKIGQQKKAQAEANNTGLNITSFKIGDGNGAYYQPNESQTALVNVKYSGNFVAGTQSQIVVNPLNLNEVLYKCFIPADVGGFTIRELGLFDADGDLILICKLPAQDKFALSSGLYQPLTFTPKIVYTNPQINAVLTPTSQIVPTVNQVINMITEYAPQTEFSIPLKNINGIVSLETDDTLTVKENKLSVLNNRAAIIQIGTCSTASGTAEKAVTLSGFTLTTGATILVTFSNTNTTLTPTLNVNSTGAKAIYNEAGVAISVNNPAYFPAGSTVEFTYDGTHWVFKKRELPGYVNGASWYRQWSDGWIEQGGYSNTTGSGTQVITFPKEFKATGYGFNYSLNNNANNSVASLQWYNKTTTTITVWNSYINGGYLGSPSSPFDWQVKGY